MVASTELSKAGQWSTLSFWKGIAPALHIGDEAFLTSTQLFDVNQETTQTLGDLMRREGYFQLPPVEWALPMDEMVALIAKLDATGIPLPFAFLYDEFWVLYVKLHRVIEPILGPGYFRMPDFWVWFVDPRREGRGWRPHRDKTMGTLRADGSPLSLTVWLPLTDATTLNGCMYMVPADRDPTYNTPEQGNWDIDYQDIRALPAQAGSIFMWNQAVLHWGSRGVARESRPRVSAAFEFQSAEIPAFNQPLMNPLTVPGFEQRLWLVAKQILQYQHMYPLEPSISEAAQQLLAEYGNRWQA